MGPKLLRVLAVATALASILLASKAHAGSLIVEHLATVREVEVRVIGGALLFEPIRGLERAAVDQLRAELASVVESALSEAGFRVVDGAASAIVLNLDHAWGSPRTDQVALLVELLLEQRATSFEGVKPELVSPVWATVWKDSRLSLTTNDKAREELVEQAKYEIEHLIGAIQQAHSYVDRKPTSRCDSLAPPACGRWSTASRTGSTSTPPTTSAPP